jgi:hypothetical protein
MKTPLALATAALAAATLAGCGGSDDGPDSEYCKDLKAARTQVTSITSNDVSKLDQAFEDFHTLAGEAPGEVKDDWKVLDGGMRNFEKALKDAGMEPSDFAELQQGKMPEGVNVDKLRGLATEVQKMSAPEFSKANDAVVKHAKDVCKIDISKK